MGGMGYGGEDRWDLDVLLLQLISLGFKTLLPEAHTYSWFYENE